MSGTISMDAPKLVYLRIFKPRGRRAYEERFTDAAKADAREADLRRWGYLVTRTERDAPVPPSKQPKAQRERREKLQAKQEAVRKAVNDKRKAARWAAIRAHADKLAADGRIDSKVAMRRARKLWPKGEIRAEVSTNSHGIGFEPVCRVSVGKIRMIGDLAAFFSVDHRIEAPTFEEALDLLAEKLGGAR